MLTTPEAQRASVWRFPAAGLVAQGLLLGVLAATVGIGGAGWLVGIACAVAMAAALAHAVARGRGDELGPASWVTLARATLAVGIAALAADSLIHGTQIALFVTLAIITLALDLVDGWVARRTATESELGARFDGEVDAFLILSLSIYVAPAYGQWVLLIGAARYLFYLGERRLPWMRPPLPPRRWRRVVTALQGVVLTVAASTLVPHSLTKGLLVISLASLAASFCDSLWWLWRHRDEAPPQPAPAPRGPLRNGLAVALSVVALLVVWFTLVAPDRPTQVSTGAFARLPLELLLVVALAVVLPANGRRVLAVVVGTVLGALLIVRILDMGFWVLFDRPFKPVDDLSQWRSGIETLRDTIGRSQANLLVDFMVVLVVGVLAVSIGSLLRVTRVAAGHRAWALRAAVALGVVWVALRVVGAPVASTSTAALAVREVQAVHTGLQGEKLLARAIARDRFSATPGNRLLTGLRGKDVLLLFVESYGRVAVQDSSISPRVDAVLDRGSAQLRDAGFSSRSAFLTSPTFGGISWLAHSTLQTGVRIDTQRAYDQLIKTNRFTLSQAFERAGWRAVSDVPSDVRAWKPGTTFYHYDKFYDSRNVGYRGPRFGYPTMPDQYTLAALRRNELAKRDRRPVFAEVDFLSSHIPWTRIPALVPWDKLGDGTVYRHVPVETATKSQIFRSSDRARTAYGHSIEYTMNAIISYVRRYGDEKTVLIVLGDHQPATLVTGQGPSHDVPISIIAHDPKVIHQIAGWGWQDGLHPDPRAPVWPMSAFRDRFLGAFGSTPASR
jgi:phosphatidylglycerophosphate synthase